MDLTNDVDTIIMEADNNNVKRMIISGCDKKSIRDGLEIIYRYDEIFMTAGFRSCGGGGWSRKCLPGPRFRW